MGSLIHWWYQLRSRFQQYLSVSVDAVTDFWDVPSRVEPEMCELRNLWADLEAAEKAAADKKKAREGEEAIMRNELATLRAEYEGKAKAPLERLDKIDLAQMIFTELTNLATRMEDVTSMALEKEKEAYGYASKKLLGIGLILESMRDKVKKCAPFSDEVIAMEDEMGYTESVKTMTAPLEQVSVKGLKTQEWMMLACRSVGSIFAEATRGGVSGLTAGAIEALKFKNLEQKQAKQLVVGTPLQQPTSSLGDELTRAVENRDFVRAVELCDETTKRFEGTVVGERVADAVRNVRTHAMNHIVVDQFLKYSDAQLTAARFAFVENILSKGSAK